MLHVHRDDIMSSSRISSGNINRLVMVRGGETESHSTKLFAKVESQRINLQLARTAFQLFSTRYFAELPHHYQDLLKLSSHTLAYLKTTLYFGMRNLRKCMWFLESLPTA